MSTLRVLLLAGDPEKTGGKKIIPISSTATASLVGLEKRHMIGLHAHFQLFWWKGLGMGAPGYSTIGQICGFWPVGVTSSMIKAAQREMLLKWSMRPLVAALLVE